MPPKSDVVYAWPVESDHRSCVYEVVLHRDGAISCSCPGWIYKRKAERGCKHTDRLTGEAERIHRRIMAGERVPRIGMANLSIPPSLVSTPQPERTFKRRILED